MANEKANNTRAIRLSTRQQYTVLVSRRHLPRESVSVINVLDADGVIVRKEICYRSIPGLSFTEKGDKIMEQIEQEVDAMMALRAKRDARRLAASGQLEQLAG